MALDLAVSRVERLANGSRHRETGDGHRVASPRRPVVLDVEESATQWTSARRRGCAPPHSDDVEGQSALGRATNARRAYEIGTAAVSGAYQQVVHEELETPLHRFTISELKWYFTHRQQAAVERPDAMTQGFLNRGAEAYSTPRFVMLYRRWQKHGDVVFEDAASPVLADALANGSGLVECLVLPHAYRHSHPWLRSSVR